MTKYNNLRNKLAQRDVDLANRKARIDKMSENNKEKAERIKKLSAHNKQKTERIKKLSAHNKQKTERIKKQLAHIKVKQEQLMSLRQAKKLANHQLHNPSIKFCMQLIKTYLKNRFRKKNLSN